MHRDHGRGVDCPRVMLPASTGEILFESRNLRIWRVGAHRDDGLVVTFDSYTDNRSLDRAGFGEAFLQSRGIPAIHVVSRDNDWYQYAETSEALLKVSHAAKDAKRVVTYGTSMGGYAAIRFADLVGAQAALSISPQYSIDPAKVPFEQRWEADARRIVFRPELDGPITASADIFLAYDPTGPDRLHYELISAETSVRPLRVWHAGHSVPSFLSEAGLLEPLVLGVVSDDLDLQAFELLLRQRKKGLSVYFSELARRQTARRSRMAVPLARRALAIDARSDIARRALAEALLSEGHVEEAVQEFETLLSGGRHLQHLMAYSKLLDSAGHSDRAILIAEEAAASAPEVGSTHYWLANLLAKSPEHLEKALAHARLAQEREPQNQTYAKTTRLIAGKLKNQKPRTSVTSRLKGWLSGS